MKKIFFVLSLLTVSVFAFSQTKVTINSSQGVTLTTFSANIPLLYNNITGVFRVDTTYGVATSLVTQYQLAAHGGGSGGGVGIDSVVTITSGTSSTVTNGYNIVRFNPSSTISSYTLTLPSTWHTSNSLLISFGGIITSGSVVTNLTIVNGSGQTLLQSVVPTTGTAGEVIQYHLISGTIDQRIN